MGFAEGTPLEVFMARLKGEESGKRVVTFLHLPFAQTPATGSIHDAKVPWLGAVCPESPPIILKKNIYLSAQGLSCSMWDLVPWPGIKPRPLHWEHGVLATGPRGKSLTVGFESYLSHLLTLCRCSVAQLCPTLCDLTDCSMPGFPVLHHLLEFAQTHVHWVSDAINQLALCRPLLLLPSVFPSIRIFSTDSALCIRWPKYWSFSFSISPSNEHWGFISFRTDFGLISLLSKGLSRVFSSTIVWKRDFFGAQPSSWSNSHMTTGKIIALTIWIFVGKVMPLLFNILSRCVIAFLARSKPLWISWLKLTSAVILQPKKIKRSIVSLVFPSICHEVMGPDAMILDF